MRSHEDTISAICEEDGSTEELLPFASNPTRTSRHEQQEVANVRCNSVDTQPISLSLTETDKNPSSISLLPSTRTRLSVDLPCPLPPAISHLSPWSTLQVRPERRRCSPLANRIFSVWTGGTDAFGLDVFASRSITVAISSRLGKSGSSQAPLIAPPQVGRSAAWCAALVFVFFIEACIFCSASSSSPILEDASPYPQSS
mmetsp:Transcript_8191/g.17745  ORF Transcript_8191/g.17745 Transcript_8191/m.17745 type:complete len:200 (+) Transcript_8191:114-713(+)